MSKEFPSTMSNPSIGGAGNFGVTKKTNLPPDLQKQEEELGISEDMDIKEDMEVLEEETDTKLVKEVKENEELIDELVLDDPLEEDNKSKEVEGK